MSLKELVEKWKDVYNVAEMEVICSFKRESVCTGSLKTAINGPFRPVWLLMARLKTLFELFIFICKIKYNEKIKLVSSETQISSSQNVKNKKRK